MLQPFKMLPVIESEINNNLSWNNKEEKGKKVKKIKTERQIDRETDREIEIQKERD